MNNLLNFHILAIVTLHHPFIFWFALTVVILLFISLRIRLKEWQLERSNIDYEVKNLREWDAFYLEWKDICRLYSEAKFKANKKIPVHDLYTEWLDKVPEDDGYDGDYQLEYSLFLTEDEWMELQFYLPDHEIFK